MAQSAARTKLILTACAAAVALSACGGGGGGPRPEPISNLPPPPAPPPPPPPAPPPPPPPPATTTINYNTAEYRNSNGAVSSRAIAAWEAGGRGQGVTVGVIDSGINPSLGEFAGRIHPASRDVAASRGVTDTEGHGTAVSGVIAMNRNGSGAMGIAFESQILSLNTANPNDCDTDDGCKHGDRDIARAIDIARTNGARVINISLGGEGVGSSVIGAVGRAAAAGVVVVISAGNDGTADPSSFALQTAQQAGNGHVVIAGAMDSARNMASFSNRAGSGAAHYLVALGVGVRTVDEAGRATAWSGTSFSAPVISGAAALLASAFPNLSGRQIVELLLTTADDAGAAGRDSHFGNGILNIARAFQPQGSLALAGSGTPIEELGEGGGSETMGDASGQMAGIVILDGYSRAYVADIAQRLSQAPIQRPLEQGLQAGLTTGHAAAGGTTVSVTMRRNLSGRPEIGLAQTGLSYEDAREARAVAGHALSRLTPRTALALGFSESGRTLQQRLASQSGTPFLVARDPLYRSGFHGDSGVAIGLRQDLGPVALTVTAERGRVYRPDEPVAGFAGAALREPGYSLAAMTADRRIGRWNLSLGLSRLGEAQTVLGGRFAFAPGGSTSYFADAVAGYRLGADWDARASYRRGWTTMPGGAGLVAGGRLSTDAWSLDLGRSHAFAAGDRLAFRVMQPLRVRGGGYLLNAPVSYDYGDLSVGYERRTFGLAPTGREIDFEAAYGVSLLGGAGYAGVNAFLRREPGHIEAMPNDLGAAMRFSLSF
ncbi:S8 family peptidase [Sphingosinicella terrae]|uniref:S8 family peptidase n=1 Tax=Sphingosinicella terrae TaxID=2172047 RepID=UPI000E0DB276|nr:S8 family peptidase [Sphingosinicella terrae]